MTVSLRPFLAGFRVKAAGSAVPAGGTSTHWQGGDNVFAGARCPGCRQALMLLWNLDARDPRFKNVFTGLERLPLLYCWKCQGELYYQARSAERDADANAITVLKLMRPKKKPAPPYRPYPKAYPQTPLELAGMPPGIWNLVRTLSTDRYGDLLSDAEKQTLSTWFGHRVETSQDLWCHQLGGIPWLVAGPEKVPCINRQCPRGKRRWPMCILAAIHNDPAAGLPLIESFDHTKGKDPNPLVQVLFHICEKCLTIHACKRGD